MIFWLWNLVRSEHNRVWSLVLRTIGYGIKLCLGTIGYGVRSEEKNCIVHRA